MARYPVLFVLLVLTAPGVGAAVEWSSVYLGEGESLSLASGAVEVPGGYLIASSTFVPQEGTHPAVVALDGAGRVRWASYYEGSSLPGPPTIEPTGDGGAVLCGTTFAAEGQQVPWLLRIDAAGEVVWSKSYGGPAFAARVHSLSDGGFILAALYQTGATSAAPWLLRLDHDGSILSQTAYPIEGGPEIVDLHELPGGELLVTGTTHVPGRDLDLWAMHLLSDGSILWAATYGTDGDELASAASVTDYGAPLLVGRTRTPPGVVLLRLYPDGWIDGQQALRGPLVGYIGSAEFDDDGNLFLGGKDRPVGGMMWAAEIDPAGRVVWAQRFGHTTFGPKLRLTSDGGVVLTTSALENLHPPWVLKIDRKRDEPGSDCALVMTPQILSFETRAEEIEPFSTSTVSLALDFRARDAGTFRSEARELSCVDRPPATGRRGTISERGRVIKRQRPADR